MARGSLLLVFCLILVGGLLPNALVLRAQAPAPSDVPSDHWAREAVAEVISRGIMPTYDDNTFRGDQPVDRYMLADILVRVLEQTLREAAGDASPDVAALRQLIDGFQNDLVAYYQSREALAKSVRLTHQSIATFSESIDLVLTRLDELEQEARGQHQRLTSRLDELSSQLHALQEENRILKERLAALEARVSGESR